MLCIFNSQKCIYVWHCAVSKSIHGRSKVKTSWYCSLLGWKNAHTSQITAHHTKQNNPKCALCLDSSWLGSQCKPHLSLLPSNPNGVGPTLFPYQGLSTLFSLIIPLSWHVYWFMGLFPPHRRGSWEQSLGLTCSSLHPEATSAPIFVNQKQSLQVNICNQLMAGKTNLEPSPKHSILLIRPMFFKIVHNDYILISTNKKLWTFFS